MAKQHYKEAVSEKDKKHFSRYLAEDEELILATGLGKAYIKSRFAIGMAWPGGIFLVASFIGGRILGWNDAIGLSIGLVLSAICGFLVAFLTYHANRYLLTTRRVLIKRGLIAIKLNSALFDKITHIEVDQHLLDKIFMRHGTVIINTAGMSKNEITLKYVDYPIELKNLLERLINREREQFGGHSGPVVTLEGEIV